MTAPIDMIVPTRKSLGELRGLVREACETSGLHAMCVLVTGQDGSAAVNRNYGLDRAESNVVLMVDDDVEGFPNGWARRLIAALRENTHAIMVSARLMQPDGQPGIMVGFPPLRTQGVHIVKRRELPTACVAIYNDGLRFDERYRGSGFEDNDFCRQLRAAFPTAVFLVHEGVRVIHRNEMKGQAENWRQNLAEFRKKWSGR